MLLLLTFNSLLLAQEKKETLDDSTVFASPSNDGLTPKESWGIHKTAFIKKLKKEGATAEEIKEQLISYEKEKAEYIAKISENLRLDEIKRKKGAEIRKRADEWRKNYELLISKNLTFSKDDENIESVSFELDSETTISFGIRAHISSGNAQLLLYNPDGEIEARLKLEYDQQNASSEGELRFTSGSLDKKITGSKPGIWQVKIIPKKATGYLAFSVSLKKNK